MKKNVYIVLLGLSLLIMVGILYFIKDEQPRSSTSASFVVGKGVDLSTLKKLKKERMGVVNMGEIYFGKQP